MCIITILEFFIFPEGLEYTSGSTSQPKGVKVSHGNVLHNCELMFNGFHIYQMAHIVCWLPPYHDMVLFNGILVPLFSGLPSILLSPLQFLQAPIIWLKIISEYKDVISGGPIFLTITALKK